MFTFITGAEGKEQRGVVHGEQVRLQLAGGKGVVESGTSGSVGFA